MLKNRSKKFGQGPPPHPPHSDNARKKTFFFGRCSLSRKIQNHFSVIPSWDGCIWNINLQRALQNVTIRWVFLYKHPMIFYPTLWKLFYGLYSTACFMWHSTNFCHLTRWTQATIWSLNNVQWTYCIFWSLNILYLKETYKNKHYEFF